MSRISAFIPHSASDLGEAEAKAAVRVIHSNFVGYGPRAHELEEFIRFRTDKKYVTAVSSGSIALQIALHAIGLRPNSLVAIPVMTCPSVASAILSCGHRPVLLDIERESLAINVASLPAKVAAIIAPHAYGAPVNLKRIDRLGLPWIEDCATSPATRIKGRPAGSFGTVAVFSLGSTKYVTGGGGGIVATADQHIARRIENSLHPSKSLARSRALFAPFMPQPFLPDLNAAVALAQFRRMEHFRKKRLAIAALFRASFSDIPLFHLPEVGPEHSFYRYILRTRRHSDVIAKELRRFGIDARTSVNPWLNQLLPKNCYQSTPWPNATLWRGKLLSLPIYPALSNQRIRHIIRSVHSVTRGKDRSQ